MALFGKIKNNKNTDSTTATVIPPMTLASTPVPTSNRIFDPAQPMVTSTWADQAVYSTTDSTNIPSFTWSGNPGHNIPYQGYPSMYYATDPYANSDLLMEVNKLAQEWIGNRVDQVLANIIRPMANVSRTLDEVSHYINHFLRELERDIGIQTQLKKVELKPFGDLEFELHTTYSPPNGPYQLNRLIEQEGNRLRSSNPPKPPAAPKKTISSQLEELLKEKLEVKVKVERVGERVSVHTQILFDGKVIADDDDCD
jgi:hypothetical protein